MLTYIYRNLKISTIFQKENPYFYFIRIQFFSNETMKLYEIYRDRIIFLKKIFQFYKLAFFVHIHSHIILFLPKFLILKIISNIFVSIENIFLHNKSFSSYEKRSHLKRG